MNAFLTSGVAVISLWLCVLTPAHAQKIWSKEFGPHSVVLFKELSRDFYYCTWAIDMEGPNLAAFDFGPKRALTFRIRWRTETTENIAENGLMHVIIDGMDFPFLIIGVHRQKVLTDVEGEPFTGMGNRSLTELLDKLVGPQSFRIYLPNGQFKDAPPADFSRAAQATAACIGEATTMNKAPTPR